MSQWYGLNADGDPVSMPMEKACAFFTDARRIVGHDEIGGVTVSTVFLVLDHGFGSKPLLFETMIFGGAHDQDMERYSSRAEAVEGHRATVERVRREATAPLQVGSGAEAETLPAKLPHSPPEAETPVSKSANTDGDE